MVEEPLGGYRGFSLPPPGPPVLAPLPVSGSRPVTGRSESGLWRWLTGGPTSRRMEATNQGEAYC